MTHGEPHPANLIVANGDLSLIDWDTAALAAPREGSRCHRCRSGPDADRCQAGAGHEVNFDVITLYQPRRYLDDLASAARLFRRPHDRTLTRSCGGKDSDPKMDQLPSWLVGLR